MWESRTPKPPQFRKTLDQLGATVIPLRECAGEPVPAVLHPKDKIMINLRIEVTALELLRDRDAAVADAVGRAQAYVRDQLAATEAKEA